ncbi:MAG TPA: PQQ-binding-like beta-propeller repeat protein [Pyrinomonadaceae bacterium]|nr:PQQ-binding-like beta-propeller repeat protein [Pyrinomonadaceae bacterium]
MRFLKEERASLLGARTSRPQLSAKREQLSASAAAFADETSALPVKSLRRGTNILIQVACAVLAVLFCPFHLVAQDTAADNWSQFRGNHQLTGVSNSQVPANLKLLWTFEAGDSIESSAAIVGGTVFVGSQKGELVALSLDDGTVYWRYNIDDPIGESSPAYSNGVIYIGDLNGWLHAVNSKDGKKIWAFKTGSEIKSSPVVVGDYVLIGSYDENLYCVSTRNGSLAWKFRTNGPVHSTPSISDGVAFIAGCDEQFRGIRISDGKEMFSLSSDAYTGASPALRGNAVYYGTFNNEVLMVDLLQHKVVWRYQHPQRQFPFYSSAAVTANRIVVGGRDKLVHGLDQNGKGAWTFATRARVESSPAIADGRVFVGSNDGRFYVLNLMTGAKVWEFNAGGPLSASPAIGKGRIVIGSQDGRLYCFG